MARITAQEVERVAALARLELSSQEVRRMTSDLDAILDDNPAELGHVEIAFRVQREPETPVPDAGAGMDLTIPADHAIAQGHVGPDLGGRAHDHAFADHRVGADPAVLPYFRAGADHHPGADRYCHRYSCRYFWADRSSRR